MGFAAILLALFAVPALATEVPALQIAVTDHTVTITNVSTGGTVVLLTASMASEGGMLRQRSGAQALLDTARTGTIAYSAPVIPLRSIWIAIDVESGRYAFGSPSSYVPTFVALPIEQLKKDEEGVIGVFDRDQLSAIMVVVRPKEGAWVARGFDGGNGDADQEHNGKLSLDTAGLAAVPGTNAPPPKRLKNGDVVAIIDPTRLDCSVVEIGK